MFLIQGLIAGYGIAIPVGAIAVLIVGVGLRKGFFAGFIAGAGAATADLLFAAIAAMAGQLLSDILAPIQLPLRLASAILLVSIGGYGLWKFQQSNSVAERTIANAKENTRIYFQFLGFTLMNPMTVAYFASLILGGGGRDLLTPFDRAMFVFGAGIASLSWQTLLAGFGSFAGKRITPRIHFVTNLLGNLIVIGLGINILFQLASI
jgi:arginine exporter protein ArgO